MPGVTSDGRDRITPVDAANGSTDYVPDERLPLLAAGWLAEGWSSEPLVELASMSPAEARTEARRLLPAVFVSLGVHAVKSEEAWTANAADRYAAIVTRAAREMDGRFTPYSAAQKVLEAVDDEPHVFDSMPGTELLRARLRAHDKAPPEGRPAALDELRTGLLELADRLGGTRG